LIEIIASVLLFVMGAMAVVGVIILGLGTAKRAQADATSARAGVSDAQAALSTDHITLSRASIKAPADGVVLTRTVEPGNAVAASLQAVTLLTVAEDLTKLRLWVYVDEADVSVVKVGQVASFTVSAYLARPFPARITRVGFGSTITDNVVTYLTYLDVDNADLSLRPGMTATATITAVERTNVMRVPNAALRFNPGRSGKVVREEVSKLWGQGLIISAADIVITEEDVDLPAGDYSFCPGAYLICP
jgi:HlyD family secretion protein